MRNRFVIILVFPIIAAIFLIGWVLYYVGSKQASSNIATKKKSTAPDKQAESTTDEGIQMGLLEETVASQHAD